MNLQIEPPSLHLDPRRPLRLQAQAGRHITAVSGTAWVTVDGEPRDIILEAGESHVFAHPGRIVIQALGGEAQVVAEEGIEAVPGVDAPVTLWDRLRGAASSGARLG